MVKKLPAIILFFLIFAANGYSQNYSENLTKEYITWGLMQAIPSPALFQDADGKNTRVQFGFKWNIIPVNISLRVNKYISRYQFFMINPVRRFTGSIEGFVQPEITTSEFKYSNINSFGLSSGARLVFPIDEFGENLSGSIGVKYTYRKDNDEVRKGYPGIEGGLYVFGGMLGIQYTQNFNSRTNYNISFYIKYF